MGLANAVQVAAGQNHACAPRRRGRALGRNMFGQLGDGTTGIASQAAPVAGRDGPLRRAAGRARVNFPASSRAAACAWGNNNPRPARRRSNTPRSVPTPCAASSAPCGVAVARAMGARSRSSGGATCWGVGSGSWQRRQPNAERRPVLGLEDAGRPSAGGSTCAVSSATGPSAAGSNMAGQLGNGGTTAANTRRRGSWLSGAVRGALGRATPARCSTTARCAAGAPTVGSSMTAPPPDRTSPVLLAL